MPRETSGRRNRRRRRKNKERKTSSDEANDPPKDESEHTSQVNSIETEECSVENRDIRDDKTIENIPASSSTNVASTSRPFRPALVKPLPGLKAVLESVGGIAEVFTRSEVMEYLVKYIKMNELYDVHNPRRVHCENDPLGKVFDCKEFSTANVCELLLKNLENVGESDKTQVLFKHEFSRHDARKRKRAACSSTDFSSDSDSSFGGLPCTLGFMRIKSGSSSSDSDATIEFPGTPGSGTELDGVEAVLYKLGKITSTSYETSTVTDSEDDLFFMEEDYGEDRFSVEYEPVSEDDFEDEQNESEVLMFDFLSDDEDTAGIGEDEYDADTEIGEEDYWNCDRCSYSNHPMTSHCVSCRNVRRNWLPTDSDRSSLHAPTVHVPLLQRSSTAPPSSSSTSSNLLNVSFPSLPRSTTIGPSPSIVPVDYSEFTGLQRSISLPRTTLSHVNHPPSMNTTTSTLASMSMLQSPSTSANSRTNASPCTCNICNSLNFVPPPPVISVNPDLRASLLSPLPNRSDSRDSGFGSGDGGAMSTPPAPDKSVSTQNDSLISSNFTLPKEACIVCLNKPRNASIIHGSTGHQVCCIRCAHRIKNSRNPRCPVCRKAIEHVVINFL